MSRLMFSCNCLNVTVDCEGIVNCAIRPGKNPVDIFFNKDICSICKGNLNIRQKELVTTRNLDQWTIYRCMFCHCEIVASSIRPGKNGGTLIGDKHYFGTSAKVNSKKRSDLYSPCFGILIGPNEIAEVQDGSGDEADYTKDVLLWLEIQAQHTEKRIQNYANSQYQELEKLRRRIHTEFQVITRKIKDSENQHLLLRDAAAITDSRKKIPKNVAKSVANPVFVSDEVFFVDDLDIQRTEGGYSVDHADIDSEEEYGHSASADDEESVESQFSKSVPVPVPKLIPGRHFLKHTSSDMPSDIAASIKAITRSMQGDLVFGDLPPPRFSSSNV